MGCEHQPENSNAIGFISLASITVDFLNFSAFSLKIIHTELVGELTVDDRVGAHGCLVAALLKILLLTLELP